MVAKRRIAKSLLGAGIGEIVNKIFPLIILHIVVSRLTVEGFGYAQFGVWIVDLANFFVIFGYQTPLSIEVGKLGDDRPKIGALVSEAIAIKLIHAIVVSIVMVGIGYLFYADYIDVIFLCSFIFFTSALDLSFVLVGRQRVFQLSMITVGVKILSLILILTLVQDKEDALLYAVLTMATNGLISVMTLFTVIRQHPLSMPTAKALYLRLVAAAPFALTLILLVLLERFDVLYVESVKGAVGAGLYGGPVRVVQSLVPLVAAVGNVFFSEIVGTDDQEAVRRCAQLGLWVKLLLVMPIIFGVWFVDDYIVDLILGGEFATVAPILSQLALGILPYAFIIVFGIHILQSHGHTRQKNLGLAAGLCVGLVSAYILFPMYSYMGIAVASVIAKSVAALFCFISARKIMAIGVSEKVIHTLIPAMLMAAVLYFSGITNFYLLVIVAAIVYAGSAVLFNREELLKLFSQVKSDKTEII